MELGIVRPSSGGGNYLETTSAVVIARIANGVDITCRCGAVTTWLGDEVKWKLIATETAKPEPDWGRRGTQPKGKLGPPPPPNGKLVATKPQ